MWSGKITAWVVLLMTLLVAYDITMRYLSQPLGEPIRAIWFTYNYSYDMSYYLYGIFFMLGDVFYRRWPVRVQASIDFVLYILAFFPGIIALVSVGAQWAAESWYIQERSFTSAAAPPIYPLKTVIPIAAALMAIQGVAETIRAVIAIRTGVWPWRLSGLDETATVFGTRGVT